MLFYIMGIPIAKKHRRKGLKRMENSDNINIMKLKRAANEIELSIIRGILEDNSIPYIVQDYGPGGHIRITAGTSLYGADVMVEEAVFDKAKALLESIGLI